MMPQLEAERQLLAIEVAQLPHMKEAAAVKVIDRYQRRAEGATRRKSAATALAEAGIPIKRIPKATTAPRRRAKRAGTGRDETEGAT